MLSSWFDIAMLATECQQAIFLRTMRLAAGGARARRESHRMVSEKIVAAAYAAQRLSLGATPTSVVADYRKHVRANVRRLSKTKRAARRQR